MLKRAATGAGIGATLGFIFVLIVATKLSRYKAGNELLVPSLIVIAVFASVGGAIALGNRKVRLGILGGLLGLLSPICLLLVVDSESLEWAIGFGLPLYTTLIGVACGVVLAMFLDSRKDKRRNEENKPGPLSQ